MTVDPALADLLRAFDDDGNAFDLARARAGLDEFAASVGAAAPAGEHEDAEVAGVRVRRYLAAGDGPELVWLHGGGWVTGSLDAVDPLCRAVVARTGGTLTSVDYRLAPEHPFPAALDDCVAVVRARAAHGPVAVGGDSAGAGLAAATCLVLRDAGVPVTAQLLLNPLVDATLSSPSISLLGSGFGLTTRALELFVGLYLGEGDRRDPRCSPLLATDLSGLPPAIVVTAEFDPLRDEGEAYAARLVAAGVPVASRRYDGMVHGFAGMSAVTPVADEALDWAVAQLVRLSSPA